MAGTHATDDATDLVADGVLSVAESMQFTKLSRAELYNLMGAGRLTFVKHGKRRLIPKRALVQLLAYGLVTTPEPTSTTG
jgi:hypothetical protein